MKCAYKKKWLTFEGKIRINHINKKNIPLLAITFFILKNLFFAGNVSRISSPGDRYSTFWHRKRKPTPRNDFPYILNSLSLLEQAQCGIHVFNFIITTDASDPPTPTPSWRWRKENFRSKRRRKKTSESRTIATGR